MSIQAMKWAWRAPFTNAAKLVLLALADFADEAGIAWPSCERLTEMTRLSARSVKRARAFLVECGLVIPQGGKRAQKVRLALDVMPENIEEPQAVRANLAPKRDKMPPSVSANLSSGKDNLSFKGDNLAPPSEPPITTNKPPESPKAPLSGKRKKKADGGHRLPDDWQPDEKLRAFAEANGCDPDEIAEAFRDYWHAAAGDKARKLDWGMTWKNWCRREKKPRFSARSPRKPTVRDRYDLPRGLEALDAMAYAIPDQLPLEIAA